jgi:HEPN domain-containing protein
VSGCQPGTLGRVVPLDEPEFTRWRSAADRAAGASSAQAAAGYFEWACFLAEQAAQLAVKALLHGVGAGGWGHDLSALVAAAGDAVGPAWPDDIGTPAERLARFYLPTRYPDAVPGGIPGDRFTSADAASAEADCRELLKAVDDTWGALLSEAMASDEDDVSGQEGVVQ